MVPRISTFYLGLGLGVVLPQCRWVCFHCGLQEDRRKRKSTMVVTS